MPLIHCSECGVRIAGDADSCPRCGSNSPKKPRAFADRKRRLLIGAILIAIAFTLLYFVWPANGLFPKNELPKGPNPSRQR